MGRSSIITFPSIFVYNWVAAVYSLEMSNTTRANRHQRCKYTYWIHRKFDTCEMSYCRRWIWWCRLAAWRASSSVHHCSASSNSFTFGWYGNFEWPDVRRLISMVRRPHCNRLQSDINILSALSLRMHEHNTNLIWSAREMCRASIYSPRAFHYCYFIFVTRTNEHMGHWRRT